MAAIALEGVEKVYATGHRAVRTLDLHVDDSELLVLVGPSGSGKSTTLRLIAGLESPTRGRITIGGRDVTALPPQARDLAMVFQSYALYPHKTVRENLAFPLETRGWTRAAIAARVQATAAGLQIDAVLDRTPAQLSGGQRQRVALGRALVREPLAFLFDEPLSNLDAGLRLETRAEIARLHRRLRATMIYVTHDQEEAMKLGDRLVVMRDGRIEQSGAPATLFDAPATLFVARFLGSPPLNVLDTSLAGLAVPRGRIVAVRPQDVTLTPPEAPDADNDATVEVVEPLGRELHVHLELAPPADGTRFIVVTSDPRVRVGDRVGVRVQRERLLVFEAESGRRLPAED